MENSARANSNLNSVAAGGQNENGMYAQTEGNENQQDNDDQRSIYGPGDGFEAPA